MNAAAAGAAACTTPVELPASVWISLIVFFSLLAVLLYLTKRDQQR